MVDKSSLGAVLASLAQLDNQATEALMQAVTHARADAWTWGEIADVLGVTRQAISQRYRQWQAGGATVGAWGSHQD